MNLGWNRCERLDGYDKVKDEIDGTFRTKKYLGERSTPMDVGGKPGHLRQQCWYQGGPVKVKGKDHYGGKFGGERDQGGGWQGTGRGGSSEHPNGECGYCGYYATWAAQSQEGDRRQVGQAGDGHQQQQKRARSPPHRRDLRVRCGARRLRWRLRSRSTSTPERT